MPHVSLSGPDPWGLAAFLPMNVSAAPFQWNYLSPGTFCETAQEPANWANLFHNSEDLQQRELRRKNLWTPDFFSALPSGGDVLPPTFDATAGDHIILKFRDWAHTKRVLTVDAIDAHYVYVLSALLTQGLLLPSSPLYMAVANVRQTIRLTAFFNRVFAPVVLVSAGMQSISGLYRNQVVQVCAYDSYPPVRYSLEKLKTLLQAVRFRGIICVDGHISDTGFFVDNIDMVPDELTTLVLCDRLVTADTDAPVETIGASYLEDFLLMLTHPKELVATSPIFEELLVRPWHIIERITPYGRNCHEVVSENSMRFAIDQVLNPLTSPAPIRGDTLLAGELPIITGSGETFSEARDDLLEKFSKLSFPPVYYRHAVGKQPGFAMPEKLKEEHSCL